MSQTEIRQAELHLRECNTNLHRSVDELVRKIDQRTAHAKDALNIAKNPSRVISEDPQGSMWLIIAFGFAVGQLVSQAIAMRRGSSSTRIVELKAS